MLTAVVWWAATYIRAHQGVEHGQAERAHEQNHGPSLDQFDPMREQLLAQGHAEDRDRYRPA